MKLRFWLFIITFLFPTSAFAYSCCASRMKNKATKFIGAEEKVYIAFGTHKPTKKTIWNKCIAAGRFSKDLKCGAKFFRYWPDTNVMFTKDKSGNSFPLKYKGKWNKNTCTEKKEFEPYNRLNKVTFFYTENRREYKKFYLKEAGGKFLLRKDSNSKFKAFNANF